jgi:PTH1 family peptidyl-tRNA hydrolase
MQDTAPDSQFATREARPPWLVLGLGNPGEKYSKTYHNAGFRVVERLAEQAGTTFRQRCGQALISDKVSIGGQTAVLVEPQTYMNLSGSVLPPLFERFDAGLVDLIVVYDDLALPLGRIRVRQKGSAGGHNGIKSLISAAETDEFLRIRIGILPDRPLGDVRDYVLSRVAASDKALVGQAEELAAKAVESLITDGIEKTMAAYNGIDLREVSKDN